MTVSNPKIYLSSYVHLKGSFFRYIIMSIMNELTQSFSRFIYPIRILPDGLECFIMLQGDLVGDVYDFVSIRDSEEGWLYFESDLGDSVDNVISTGHYIISWWYWKVVSVNSIVQKRNFGSLMAYQDYGIYGRVVWQFQQSLDFHITESCNGNTNLITLSSLMSNSVFNIEGV